jgi:hypothetical protein
MTREEVSTEIGKTEFTTGQILGISGRILFENLGIWLLFSLAVFLPTGIVLQALTMRVPMTELLKMLQEGNADILSRKDIIQPLLVMYGTQILFAFIYVLTNIAACLFTDKWLQKSAELPSPGRLALSSLKAWPQALVVSLLYLLGIAAILLLAFLLVSFGFFLMMMLALAIVAAYWTIQYYYAVSAASVRPYKGIDAFKYAASIIRGRAGRAVTLILTCVIINSLFTLILQTLTSSFFVLASRPALLCITSGLLGVIGNLPNFLISIAATVYLINQEQTAMQRTQSLMEGFTVPDEEQERDPWAGPDDFSKKA